MVSKITKKVPKLSTSLSRRHRRKTPSPAKCISISTSFHHSLRSARRKLLNLFAHLAVLSSSSTSNNRGFTRLNPVSPSPSPLPPPSPLMKKTIILDLDETLVHSKTDPPPENYDFIIHPRIDGQIVPFYVLKRPGVDELLKKASERFEVVVFTAGLREYASLVLDLLDPTGEVILHRLYRDSCREVDGRFVKDLSEVGRDLGRVAIVDDNPGSYALQRENAVPIKPFVSDLDDKELGRVMEFFEVAALFDDMRDAVTSFLAKNGDKET